MKNLTFFRKTQSLWFMGRQCDVDKIMKMPQNHISNNKFRESSKLEQILNFTSWSCDVIETKYFTLVLFYFHKNIRYHIWIHRIFYFFEIVFGLGHFLGGVCWDCLVAFCTLIVCDEIRNIEGLKSYISYAYLCTYERKTLNIDKSKDHLYDILLWKNFDIEVYLMI